MILTKQQRDRLLQSATAGCAILSVQDCLGSLETIADLERQRDTAHAAAIQAVAAKIVAEDWQWLNAEPLAKRILTCILTLTPAVSQRLYDLRIAEAVRDALAPATQLAECDGRRLNGRARELVAELEERLASASAEVERLSQPSQVNNV